MFYVSSTLNFTIQEISVVEIMNKIMIIFETFHFICIIQSHSTFRPLFHLGIKKGQDSHCNNKRFHFFWYNLEDIGNKRTKWEDCQKGGVGFNSIDFCSGIIFFITQSVYHKYVVAKVVQYRGLSKLLQKYSIFYDNKSVLYTKLLFAKVPVFYCLTKKTPITKFLPNFFFTYFDQS